MTPERRQQIGKIVSEIETLVNTLQTIADEEEREFPPPAVIDWDGETAAEIIRVAAEELETAAGELSIL